MEKYPISVQSFPMIRQEGLLYVDKTDLVYELAQHFQVFLSRPHRFGRSLLLSTIEAYFSGKKELFEGLKIYDMEKDWKKHEVINISFLGNFSGPDDLEMSLHDFFSRMTEKYHLDLTRYDDLGCGYKLHALLRAIKEQSGERVVVLVDECDKPLQDALRNPEVYKNNQTLLLEFYSVFKEAGAELEFVLFTGLTRIAPVSVFSGFNHLEDITFDYHFKCLCGFTEEELYTYFSDEIVQLAKKYNCTEEKMKSLLKNMYGGYHFSHELTEVYNPNSLLKAFNNMKIENYWWDTGNSSWFVDYMRTHSLDLKEVLNHSYNHSRLMNHEDTDNTLAFVYQSGYLTIAGVERDCDFGDRYRLKFPNKEVQESYEHWFGKKE